MVYTFFFALLIVGLFVLEQNGGRKIYLLLMMIFLLLIIGLRDITVGYDTLSYVEDFYKISGLSLSGMLNKALSSREPLYIIITWLPSQFAVNYTLYLFVWALFPTYSLYMVFNHELSNCNDYLIAIIVFFLLGLFAFYVAGIRQTAVISIVMTAAIRMNKSFFQNTHLRGRLKAIFRYLLFVGIAYLIHNSAIIALLAILGLFIRIRWWIFPIIVLFFFVGSYANINTIIMVSEILYEDRFASYGTIYESSQNMSAFFMQLILFIMCIIVKEPLINRNKQNSFYLIMILIGLLFQSLSPMMAEMFRVSFYFSVFGIVLVPRAIKEYPKQIWNVAYIAFVTISLIYLFLISKSNLPEYHSVLGNIDRQLFLYDTK